VPVGNVSWGPAAGVEVVAGLKAFLFAYAAVAAAVYVVVVVSPGMALCGRTRGPSSY